MTSWTCSRSLARFALEEGYGEFGTGSPLERRAPSDLNRRRPTKVTAEGPALPNEVVVACKPGGSSTTASSVDVVGAAY